jgi:tRNA modification GTPase
MSSGRPSAKRRSQTGKRQFVPERHQQPVAPSAQTLDTDTIVAIATAPGQAGIGILRLSGPLAVTIAERVAGPGLAPRQATYRTFRDMAGDLLDSGLILYFPAPHSFTGEDVVEFQGHGSPMVLQMIQDQLMGLGARLARPGEFTERAFLNGKMDLVQAEAVADLIASSSTEAARGANRSLSGEFSERVHQIDALVVDLRMFIEAAIDFPDEDIDLLAEGQIAVRVGRIIESLESLRDTCAQGVILRDGIKLALIGPPNVGKSSLLNRLAGDSRAIVSSIPGTTRDLIKADLDLAGLPVELVDTAGLRESDDEVEREGVRRALDEAENADIIIYINDIDRSTEWSVGSDDAFDLTDPRVLSVLNKLDLLSADRSAVIEQAEQRGFVLVSALTGAGIDELRSAIRERAGFAPPGNLFTARKRHLVALDQALSALDRARTLASNGLAGELIAEELKAAHLALGEIVGQMSSDALLGEIFSRFCIGK